MRLRHLQYLCACLFLAGTRGYITTKTEVLEEEVSKRKTVVSSLMQHPSIFFQPHELPPSSGSALASRPQDNIIASLEAAQESVDSSSLTELEQRSARAALRPVLAEALRAAAELERIAAGPEPGSAADPEPKQQQQQQQLLQQQLLLPSDGPTQALRWASLNGTSPDGEARQDILRASDDLMHASEIMRASDEAAGSSDGAEEKGVATGKTGSEGEGEPPYAIFLELGGNVLQPAALPATPTITTTMMAESGRHGNTTTTTSTSTTTTTTITTTTVSADAETSGVLAAVEARLSALLHAMLPSALASLAPPSMPSPPPTGVPVVLPSVAAEAAGAASGTAAEEEVSGGSVADEASADVASGPLEASSGEAAFVESAFVESASVEASSGAPLPSPDASPEP